MRRLAIFVEGLTEELFVERLLTEIAGTKGLVFEKRHASGGKVKSRTFTSITAPSGSSSPQYYVLIFNCGNDSRVGSDIREQYPRLKSTGYKTIIGLRDAFPTAKNLAEVAKLRRLLNYKVDSRSNEVAFILSGMEIEAWFISEHTHFERISKKLTLDQVRKVIHLDPRTDDVQKRLNPGWDLDAIYRRANKKYTKDEFSIRRTITALDFERVHLELGEKFDDLKLLIKKIDKFLSPTAPR